MFSPLTLMVQTPLSPQILYPDSDGKPMAENTRQYRWIVRLVTNLKKLLKDQTAFVAGDLLWYPVQVNQPPAPCQAPDAMVVLGRPDGERGSYKQWEEEGIAPQVVFEILSPSNTWQEMRKKEAFYQTHGVLEMYGYDPDRLDFWGRVRDHKDEGFRLVMPADLPWSSPLLNIRFAWDDQGLLIFHPDGEPFKDPDQFADERDAARQELAVVKQERDRLAAKLRELGLDPDQV